MHAKVFYIARQQRFGCNNAHFRATQRGQRVNLRTRDARMQHVADDCNAQVVERPLVVTQREHVEQALGRVRTATVTGIDDMNVRLDMARDQVAGAGGGMAHDEHVGLHRRQIGDGVEQGFALALRGSVDVQVDHVGGQPLGGDLEGCAGTRGVLEEDVEDCLAAQQRHFLHVPIRVGHRDERGCGIEYLVQDARRQAIQRQQMAQAAIVGQLQVVGAHGFLFMTKCRPSDSLFSREMCSSAARSSLMPT